MKYNVVIVGATGAVGRKMLSTLLERSFPIKNIILLASKKSEGKIISLNDQKYVVQSLEGFNFKNADLAFFSAGSEVSKKYATLAEKKGCYVIDNTSFFRLHKDIPLVIPEINSKELAKAKRKIIANPNCSTIQMLVALKPIHDLSKITEIIVSTYQSVSGAGQKAIEELNKQTLDIMNEKNIDIKYIPKQIAFNVVPQIDIFLANQFTKEEMKMVNETKKILHDSISVNATCVRVGTIIGHAESIFIKLETDQELKSLERKLDAAKGIKFSKSDYFTPVDCSGKNWVYVSRLRKDINKENAFNLWVVSDNLLKGAALNSVQIAESLVEQKII